MTPTEHKMRMMAAELILIASKLEDRGMRDEADEIDEIITRLLQCQPEVREVKTAIVAAEDRLAKLRLGDLKEWEE